MTAYRGNFIVKDDSAKVAADLAIVEADLSAHIADVDNPHATTKTQVGLSNVDNTSDVNKPVSTAQQAALDLKAELAGSSSQDFAIDNLVVAGNTSLCAGGLTVIDNTVDAIDIDNSSAFNTSYNVAAGASHIFRVDGASRLTIDGTNFLIEGTIYAEDSSFGAVNSIYLNTINMNTSASPPSVPTDTASHIVGEDATTALIVMDSFAGVSQIVGRRAQGSNASPTAVTSSSNILTLGAKGYGTSAYSTADRATINLAAAQTWTNTAQGTKITFETTPVGSAAKALALTINADKSLVSTGTIKTAGYTVATLPAGVVGTRAYVTNALAPAYGAAVVGGGAVTIPVFYDGAAWIVA